MKKILLIVALLFLIGCDAEPIEGTTNVKYIQDNGNFEGYIVDKETCVEYLRISDMYKFGLSPRLNADGTPILNEMCLKGKE